MEHKIVLGGEQFLPFARSRIKALRATGLSHASQQFEIDGVSVKVRIDGEHEYISISSDQGDAYSTIPNSAQNLDGPAEPDSHTLVKKGTSKVSFLHPINRQEGALDWVSYDGTTQAGKVKYGKKLITWSSGLRTRYNPIYAPTDSFIAMPVEENYVWVSGLKINVGFTPWGCGMRSVVDGAVTRTIVIVFRKTAQTLITLTYFDMSEVVNGSVIPHSSTTHSAPQDPEKPDVNFWYLQPMYICGRGQVCGTLVSAPSDTGALNSTRFFKTVGTITISAAGVVTASFTDTALPSSTGIGLPEATYIECIGVDVTPAGEIKVATQKTVGRYMAASSVSIITGTVSLANPYPGVPPSIRNIEKATFISAHYECDEYLYIDDVLIYSNASYNSHYVNEVTVTPLGFMPIFGGYPNTYWQIDESREIKTGTIRSVIVHDLDARYMAVAYTRTNKFGGTLSQVRPSYIQYPNIAPTVPEYVTLSPSVGSTSNFIGSTVNAVNLEIAYQSEVAFEDAIKFYAYAMPGTIRTGSFNRTEVTATVSSVLLLGRRIASRSHRSLVISTYPLADRSFEAINQAGQLLAGRTLNVMWNGSALSPIPIPDVAALGLTLGDTEIALSQLAPINN